MRIAYWTTDEVNEHLAHALATECGDRLCPLTPKDWSVTFSRRMDDFS
jgi:hypothetical protein